MIGDLGTGKGYLQPDPALQTLFNIQIILANLTTQVGALAETLTLPSPPADPPLVTVNPEITVTPAPVDLTDLAIAQTMVLARLEAIEAILGRQKVIDVQKDPRGRIVGVVVS